SRRARSRRSSRSASSAVATTTSTSRSTARCCSPKCAASSGTEVHMGMRVESAEERLVRLEEQVELWRTEHDHQAEREQALRHRLSEQTASNRHCVEQLAAAEQRIGHLGKVQAVVHQPDEDPIAAGVPE